jgi:CIC family chloride channel protein
MIPVGTAAGIAAIFNAPMTGVVFAMEEVLGSAGRGVLGGTIIAAVAGAVVQRIFLGGRHILPAPAANWTDVRELVGFAVLGILAGVLSAFAIRSTLWLRKALRNREVSPVAQAVAGGAFVGAIGTFVPSIFSVGYTTTSRFLHGDGDLIFSATALCGKLIAFIAATATGLLGGTFAPSLFLGAALGSTVGGAMQGLLNAETVEPAAYALVGMGAVFGGLLRSPLASALIVFELTGDYALILPLMLAIALSVFISTRLAPRTLTEDQLKREGYERTRSGDPLSSLSVSDVMTRKLIVARRGMTFRDVIQTIGSARHREYPVVDDDNKLQGVLKSGAIVEALSRGALDQFIDSSVEESAVVARPTQTLLGFLTMMANEGADRCPVVDGANRLAGFVSPSDVIRARMKVRPEEEELGLLG